MIYQAIIANSLIIVTSPPPQKVL